MIRDALRNGVIHDLSITELLGLVNIYFPNSRVISTIEIRAENNEQVGLFANQ